jgi:Na+/melibiose symporter-like transporter
MVAAIAALAAAAVVVIVALSFALYAAVRDLIGPAWAAAAVAGVFAVIALILAFALTRKARPPKAVQGDDQNLTSKLIDLARERPLVAAGAVAAAATVVIRNPRILMAVITGLFASRAAQPPTGKRRR